MVSPSMYIRVTCYYTYSCHIYVEFILQLVYYKITSNVRFVELNTDYCTDALSIQISTLNEEHGDVFLAFNNTDVLSKYV